ncbi:hypothetical protein ECFRIK1996_0489, partial [Escherichia coli FRIK1996]
FVNINLFIFDSFAGEYFNNFYFFCINLLTTFYCQLEINVN